MQRNAKKYFRQTPYKAVEAPDTTADDAWADAVRANIIEALEIAEKEDWENIFRGERFEVVFPDNSMISYRHHPDKTVRMLKARLSWDTGLPTTGMTFYFRDSEEPLKSYFRLPAAGINPGSRVLIAMI